MWRNEQELSHGWFVLRTHSQICISLIPCGSPLHGIPIATWKMKGYNDLVPEIGGHCFSPLLGVLLFPASGEKGYHLYTEITDGSFEMSLTWDGFGLAQLHSSFESNL